MGFDPEREVEEDRGVRITIVFPARKLEVTRASMTVMPPSLTLLAALTPEKHGVNLVDMSITPL